MDYYLFIDESGDHDLTHFDPAFPVFTLCGVVMSSNSFEILKEKIGTIKRELWGDRLIVLHSTDIRKYQKGFEVLLDAERKKYFLDSINDIVANLDYVILSATIHKEKYVKQYLNTGDVYEVALEFIIERTIFCLDTEKRKGKYSEVNLHTVVEKRGKKEDAKLLKHYNHLRDSGTRYMEAHRIQKYFKSFNFESKKDNNLGVMVDYLAMLSISLRQSSYPWLSL